MTQSAHYVLLAVQGQVAGLVAERAALRALLVIFADRNNWVPSPIGEGNGTVYEWRFQMGDPMALARQAGGAVAE